MSAQDGSRLTARGVRKRFGGRHTSHLAVDGVDFEMSAGELVGIIGESGSGKSTLARMLVGLEMPTEGTVELDGISISTLLARSPREMGCGGMCRSWGRTRARRSTRCSRSERRCVSPG